jgi:hypothetical protein
MRKILLAMMIIGFGEARAACKVKVDGPFRIRADISSILESKGYEVVEDKLHAHQVFNVVMEIYALADISDVSAFAITDVTKGQLETGREACPVFSNEVVQCEKGPQLFEKAYECMIKSYHKKLPASL